VTETEHDGGALDAWAELSVRLGSSLLRAFYAHRGPVPPSILVTRTTEYDGEVTFEFQVDDTPDLGYVGRHVRDPEDDDG
jgi:hypothetical protein